jgi:hypothetical protein
LGRNTHPPTHPHYFAFLIPTPDLAIDIIETSSGLILSSSVNWNDGVFNPGFRPPHDQFFFFSKVSYFLYILRFPSHCPGTKWANLRCVTETIINTDSVCHISKVKHFSTGGFRVLSFESMLTAFPPAIRELLDLEHWDMFPQAQFLGTNSGTVCPFWVMETGECTFYDWPNSQLLVIELVLFMN